MSSNASCTPLGDPKYGGALCLLPREIRDKIYRLLVKGSYIVTGPSFRKYTGKGNFVCTRWLDFPILQLSTVVSREAREILYSESSFIFHVSRDASFNSFANENIDRVKKVAPMIKRVIFYVSNMWIPPRFDTFEEAEADMDKMVACFGDANINRQSLLVKMWGHEEVPLRKKSHLLSVYECLRALVGFRTVVVELSFAPVLFNPRLDYTDKFRIIKEMGDRLTPALAEQLEPAFGPSISSLRFDTGHALIRGRQMSIDVVSFLEFHPGKHRFYKYVAEQ